MCEFAMRSLTSTLNLIEAGIRQVFYQLPNLPCHSLSKNVAPHPMHYIMGPNASSSAAPASDLRYDRGDSRASAGAQCYATPIGDQGQILDDDGDGG